MPRLQSVDWRIDYLLSSSSLQELNTPSIQLKFNISDPNDKNANNVVAFDLTSEKFRVLLNGNYNCKIIGSLLTYINIELRSARDTMDTIINQ